MTGVNLYKPQPRDKASPSPTPAPLQRETLRVPVQPPEPEPPPRPRAAKPKAAPSKPLLWLVPRFLAHAMLSRDGKCRLEWRQHGYSVRAMLPGNDDVTLVLPYDANERWRHAPRGVDMQVLSAVASRVRKHEIAEFASLTELADLAGCHRNCVRQSLDYWRRLALIVADDYEPGHGKGKAKVEGRSVTRDLPPYIEAWQVIGQRLRITVSAKWTQLARRYFMPIELPLPANAAAQNALLYVHTWLVSPPPRKQPDAVRKKKVRERLLVARFGITAERGTVYARKRLIAALREVGRRLPCEFRGNPKEGQTVGLLTYDPTKPCVPKAEAKAKTKAEAQAAPQARPAAAAKPQPATPASNVIDLAAARAGAKPAQRMDDPANAEMRTLLYGGKRTPNQAAIDLIVIYGDPTSKSDYYCGVDGVGHQIAHFRDAYAVACERLAQGPEQAPGEHLHKV